MRRLAVLLIAIAACGDDRPQAAPREQPQRRVIEPPSGTVRPLPPYAILGDGVGPYKLNQSVAALMDRLPKGPRMARFEIPRLLHAGVVRAEDDTVLIGTEISPAGATSTTSFIAVVGSQVASMESGLKVGSTLDEVKKQVAMPDDRDRARDPRLAILSSARNARLLIDKKRVVAIALIADPPSTELVHDDCVRPPSTDTALGACLTSGGELVEWDDDEVIVKPIATEKPLRVPVPNVVFAVPLRHPDGRDEIIAITRSGDTQQRTWWIYGFRFEAGKVKLTVDLTPLYQVTSTQSRWIGAELREIDLYLELANRGESIEVGGLLTTRAGERIRDVVAISPVTVARRNHKPATTDPEPGAPVDAGVTRGEGSAGTSQGSARP